jgi:hypothetical protein
MVLTMLVHNCKRRKFALNKVLPMLTRQQAPFVLKKVNLARIITYTQGIPERRGFHPDVRSLCSNLATPVMIVKSFSNFVRKPS